MFGQYEIDIYNLGREVRKMNVYDFKVKAQDGSEVSLEQYKGKVLLIVNTATGCGFTPQYEALEALYEKYRDQGFVILDFPCNQFFRQAPGSDAEFNQFCSLKYNTQFPRFKKIDVKGKNQEPLFGWLITQNEKSKPINVKWNFAKFLINKQGEVVGRFAPTDKPLSFEQAIVDELNK